MIINVTKIIRRTMGWCPNGTIIDNKSDVQPRNTNIENINPGPDETVLWLSRLFGVLNLLISFIAVIDLSSAVYVTDIPHTSEQWTGFLTAIAVLAGAIAGLTIRRNHSTNRKMVHLLIAAFGLMLTFGSLIRLVRTIFAGWLS